MQDNSRRIIRYSIGDRKKSNDYTEELHRNYNGNQQFKSQRNNYADFSQPVESFKPYKKAPIYATTINEHRVENDFRPSRVDYKTAYVPQKSVYQSNLDGPRVVRVNNSNFGSFKGRTVNNPSKKHDYQFRMPQSNIIDNINKNAFMDKYKINMADDLNGRMQECTEVNRRLEEEISNLKKALETEKRKTEEVVQMCQQELEEAKVREEETIKGIKNIERENNERLFLMKQHDERNYEVT